MTLEISAMMASITGSTGGLRKQEDRVAKAADDINNAFTAAQNAQAADSVSVSDRAAVVPAVEDAVRGAVLGSGDITQPVVDLLQSVQAYKANAAAFRVTSDIEQTVVDLVGKK